MKSSKRIQRIAQKIVTKIGIAAPVLSIVYSDGSVEKIDLSDPALTDVESLKEAMKDLSTKHGGDFGRMRDMAPLPVDNSRLLESDFAYAVEIAHVVEEKGYEEVMSSLDAGWSIGEIAAGEVPIYKSKEDYVYDIIEEILGEKNFDLFVSYIDWESFGRDYLDMNFNVVGYDNRYYIAKK